MATKYEGLTSAQWANRIVDYNPGKFDKSALVKHYTAQQLGKFQEGGNIQLAKALKGAKTAKKSSISTAPLLLESKGLGQLSWAEAVQGMARRRREVRCFILRSLGRNEQRGLPVGRKRCGRDHSWGPGSGTIR